MATLLITVFPARGHINATQKLARALRSRGHRVVYASPEDARELMSEDAEFLPMLEEHYPKGTFQPFTATRFRDQLRHMRAWARRSNSALQAMADGALERLFERVQPDLLLCDPLMPYLGLVAHGLKVPTLILNTSLPQEVIHPFLSHPPTRLSRRLRNQATRALFSAVQLLGIVPRMTQLTEQIARRYGYPVDQLGMAPEYLLRGLPEMILAPRDLVMPEGGADPRYLFVAPSIDLERSEPDFPWNLLAPDKPLIYFSMGSMGGYGPALEERLLQTMLETARARPQWQFVLSVNPTHNPARFDGAAPNLVAVKHAPQLQLLQRAAAVITHAGFNTLKECIYFGVPMVLVPLAFDQPAAARLMERQGLGLVCPPAELKPEALLQRLDGLMGQQTWRSAMTSMQSVFRQSEQDNSAADAIERLLQERQAPKRKEGAADGESPSA